MTIKVLVVDDSLFFRKRLTEIFNSDILIEVIGTASNGAEAIEKALKIEPDVITMDIEMPVMDGITAVREIMKKKPTSILMFSSMTLDGAQATLDALEAGALDFLPKVFNEISEDKNFVTRQLCARVRALAGKKHIWKTSADISVKRVEKKPLLKSERSAQDRMINSYSILVIGTSTGGPTALQIILAELPANFPLPILLVQHMPPTFTPAFAKRLNSNCKITVKHAEDGDRLAPGTALLAPGGFQLTVSEKKGVVRVNVLESSKDDIYKPCVDSTFISAANVFERDVLAIVLTGMGRDGREGARLLKQKGSTVWVQDEETCVVYGMPMSIANAGLADKILPLQVFGQLLT